MKVTSVFIFRSNERASYYGVGTYIKQLTNSLLKLSNVQIYLVNYFSYRKEFSTTLIKPHYTIIDLPQPFSLSMHNEAHKEKYKSVICCFLLSEIIKEQKNKIVFLVNDYTALAIVKQLREMFGFPFISVIHSAQWQMIFNGNKMKFSLNDNREDVSNYLSKEKELYETADKIVSVTGYMKDFLVHYYKINQEKIFVVPNGIEEDVYALKRNDDTLKKEMGFLPEEKLIIYTGRLDPCKGIFFLLEAFSEVVKQYNNVRLILIGDGEIDTCIKYCKNNWSKVSFTGFIEKEQLFKFYQIADLGIVPSIYDHCPYSVLEMISFKIPLIMSDIDGLNEILDENQCLFLRPEILQNGEVSYNVRDITNSILNILQNEDLATKIANAAYTVIDKKFSAQKMAKAMESIISQLSMSKPLELLKEF